MLAALVTKVHPCNIWVHCTDTITFELLVHSPKLVVQIIAKGAVLLLFTGYYFSLDTGVPPTVQRHALVGLGYC